MNLGLAVLGWPEVGGRQLMASWFIFSSALYLTGASGLGCAGPTRDGIHHIILSFKAKFSIVSHEWISEG